MNDWMLEQIKIQADNQYMSVNEKVKSILHDFFTKYDPKYNGHLTDEYVLSKLIERRVSHFPYTMEFIFELKNYSLYVKIEFLSKLETFESETNIYYKDYKNEKRKQYTIVPKTDFKQD